MCSETRWTHTKRTQVDQTVVRPSHFSVNCTGDKRFRSHGQHVPDLYFSCQYSAKTHGLSHLHYTAVCAARILLSCFLSSFGDSIFKLLKQNPYLIFIYKINSPKKPSNCVFVFIFLICQIKKTSSSYVLHRSPAQLSLPCLL